MLKLISLWNRQTRRNSRAQAMVEFALVLPILLLLVVAIIDFGRALFIYSQVSNSAREAVRYGAAADAADASNHLNCTGVEARARSMFSLPPTTLAVSVYVERPITGTATFQQIPCTPGTTTVSNGDRVRVKINATVSLLTLQMIGPLFGNGLPTNLPINYDASRTIVPAKGYGTGPTDTPRPLRNWAPLPPTNFQLSCSGLQVSATWSGTENTYYIYREPDNSKFGPFPASPATNFATVNNGVATTFHIVSVNAMNIESDPVEKTITCTSVLPGPVASFTLTTDCAHKNNNDVIVNWTAPTSGGTVNHYVIYDASGNPVSTSPSTLGPNVTSATISRVINEGQVLSFHIVPYNNENLAGPAISASVACKAALPPPEPPPSFSLSCNALSISGTWVEPTLGLVYQIYRSSDNVKVWEGTGSTASDFATMAAAGPAPGYYIKSVQNGLVSLTFTNATPATCYPLQPTNFQLSCSGLSVSAFWTEPSGSGLSYRIYQSGSATVVWPVTGGSAGGSSALDFFTAQNGVQVGFDLVTVQNGLESGHVSANTTCTPAVPPTNFVVTCNGTSVSAAWVESSPNLGYRIYKGAGANWIWPPSGNPGTGNSATGFDTLPFDTPTTYYIASVYGGYESTRVPGMVTCPSGTLPPPPTNFSMTCSGLTVSAAWTEPNPVDPNLLYKIYRTPDNTVVWGPTRAVSATFTSIINGVQTYDLVSVLNGVDSIRVPGSVTCNATVPAPTNFTVTCTNTQISGVWTQPLPNLGYRIYQGTGATPVYSSTASVSSAPNFTTLANEVPTTFYITAVLNGQESARTASNQVTCVAPRINLSWVPSYPVRMGKGANKQAFYKVKLTFANGSPVYTQTTPLKAVSIYDTGTNPPTLKGYLDPLGTDGTWGLPSGTYGNCFNIPTTNNLNVRVDALYNGATASMLSQTPVNNSITSCP